jgi:hypothetical protein
MHLKRKSTAQKKIIHLLIDIWLDRAKIIDKFINNNKNKKARSEAT